jgi:hypothetical protein
MGATRGRPRRFALRLMRRAARGAALVARSAASRGGDGGPFAARARAGEL